MKEWKIDTDRLISLVADRMYSDQSIASLRELISNSIDAKYDDRPVDITINIEKHALHYEDNGRGIPLQEFDNVYGVIATGHERNDDSIGMFGVGRLALISKLQGSGIVTSTNKGVSKTWVISRKGWSDAGSAESSNGESGFLLEFPDLSLDMDVLKLTDEMARIFSIPLLEKVCTIYINNRKLQSLIPDSASFKMVDGIKIYYSDKPDGAVHYCHRGIEVQKDNYSGLEAWIDQEYLHIKTDREGFVRYGNYIDFMEKVKSELRVLRPHKILAELEAKFISRVMKRFKGYVRGKKIDNVPEIILPIDKIKTHFNMPIEEVARTSHEEKLIPVYEDEISNLNPTDPIQPMEAEPIVSKEPISEQSVPLPTESIPLETSNLTESIPQPKKKKITIEGTRAVDMGVEYPMIFFEKDPLVLIFNTTHPVMKEMIETETVDDRTVGVIFERMLECYYLRDDNDMEKIKYRWTEVDRSLQYFM
jgi:hypothetical protein